MRTPRLLLDEAKLDRNIEAMAAWTSELGLRLRPHLKTHKCPQIMQRQLAAGAQGITVATLHEAEVFIEAGADDVLIAYPPVGGSRLEALEALIAKARVIVTCHTEQHVRGLSALGSELGHTFEYYWEVDCGAQRLGTRPGEETADILERLANTAHTRLSGILTFPGHGYKARGRDERVEIARAEISALVETKTALERRGLDAGTLSGGSTTTVWEAEGKDAIDEYRCGNYVFYDATQVALGNATVDDCALTVESTVVGRPAPARVILDAGSKALAAERMGDATPSFGAVVEHPELTVQALYEEHAICVADRGETPLREGDVVQVIPNHACTCANLHAAYAVLRSDGSMSEWPVAARGWRSRAELPERARFAG